MLLLSLYALLRTKGVQTWAAQKLAGYFSGELGTTITIGGVDIDFPGTLVLEKLYVEDLQTDTLAYIGRLGVSYRSFTKITNNLQLGVVSINRASFFLKKQKGATATNMDFILNYFSSGDTTKSTKDFLAGVKTLTIKESSFRYKDYNRPNAKKGSVNFDDLDVSKLNIEAVDIQVKSGNIRADILSASLYEKSGFSVQELVAQVKVNNQEVEAKNLYIRMPKSTLRRYFSMKYTGWDAFSKFFDEVRFYASLENATIAASDIVFFAVALERIKSSVTADGVVYGPLRNLKSEGLRISTAGSTYISTSFTLKGLPEVKNLWMDIQIKELHSNKADATAIINQISSSKVVLPALFNKVGEVYVKGNFKGYYTDFKAKANLVTDVGNLDIDGSMKLVKGKQPEYDAFINTEALDVGKLLDAEKYIGKITAEAQFSGRGFDINKLHENVLIDVHKATLNNYTYQNIVIQGLLDRKLFSGSVNIDDKNIGLYFDGTIDLNNKEPVFAFVSTIRKANVQALNLYSKPLVLSTDVAINITGINLNSLLGSISLANLRVETPEKEYRLEQVNLVSEDLGAQKQLTLTSSIADVSIKGIYDFRTIVSAAKRVLQTYVPAYSWGTIKAINAQNFSFLVTLKNTNPITELFFPEIKIGGNNQFRGAFNSDEASLRVTGELKQLDYRDFSFRGIVVDQENSASRLDINIGCNTLLQRDSVLINNINMSNSIAKNELQFNVKLADYSARNQLDLNGKIAFSTDSFVLRILPSELYLNREAWAIKEAFSVSVGKERVNIQNFSLKNTNQEIQVQGVISKSVTEGLKIKLQNLDLKTFSQFTQPLNISLAGIVNADADIYALLDKPRFTSKAFISNLVYNGTKIGESVAVSTTWNERERVSFAGTISNNSLKTVDLYGNIYPKGDQNLDINIEMTETELNAVQPFIVGIVSDIAGQADATLKLTGSFAKPQINGVIKFNKVALTVDYLKNRLTIDDNVFITSNKILLKSLTVTDPQGNKAIVTGDIDLDNIKNPYFNVALRATNFLCLNTTKLDNASYYGTARASGVFRFTGPLSTMRINIEATTKRGTQFFIPLGNEGTLGQQNFITFKAAGDTLKWTGNAKNKFTGISLNLDLDVTEDAQVQLIFDEKVGDLIKGRGNANLRLAINTLGDFEMYGTYEITEGEYLFTLQNLINKRLKVVKGGTVRWNGNPFEAQINISAIYQTSAPIIGLYQAAEYRGSITKSDSARRVATECRLTMQNSLFAPDISFGIEFPRNNEIKNELSAYLNNQDNVNTQVLSLLVANRFTGNINAGSGAASGGVEVLSNQVSNWLSSTVYRGLDININSLNGAGGSLSLFDDRVVINGNVLTYEDARSTSTTTTTQRSNTITGDVSAEYKISKNGNLRAKAFNKTVSNDLLIGAQGNQNVQGLGLLYRAEFDSFGEFWRKLWRIKPKEKPEPMP